jgi:hypothetical protein
MPMYRFGGVNRAEESQFKGIVARDLTISVSDGFGGCDFVYGNAKL